VPRRGSLINRLSRVGIAVVLLAGVLWAGGVAEARRLPSAVTVCVMPHRVWSDVWPQAVCVLAEPSFGRHQNLHRCCVGMVHR